MSSDEIHQRVKVVSLPKTLPFPGGLYLGGHLEVTYRGEDICEAKLQLYVESETRGVINDLRLTHRPPFPGRQAAINWLQRLSWGDVTLLLNPERCWPEDPDGGFTLQAETPFKQLMKQLRESFPPAPVRTARR